jgi:hypothetical protein
MFLRRCNECRRLQGFEHRLHWLLYVATAVRARTQWMQHTCLFYDQAITRIVDLNVGKARAQHKAIDQGFCPLLGNREPVQPMAIVQIETTPKACTINLRHPPSSLDRPLELV